MYMPRLRARQFEVFAVLNSASALAAGGVVRPILEPVSVPNKLFFKRLGDIAEAGLRCVLVLNPSVGEIKDQSGWEALGDAYLEQGLLGFHGLAILSNAESDHIAMSSWVEKARASGAEFSVDIIHEPDLSVTLAGSSYRGIQVNVAEDRTVPTAYGLPLGGRPVIWAGDPFPALARNRDYVGKPESIFSTRVSGFASAGYAGVSDFLTVGRAFHTGGGPAYAVVIHLTYVVEGVVRLRHFCSESNETQDDPGGKFLEALAKLIEFVDLHSIASNIGIRGFQDLYKRQHYPGLGKVKELSMINHMQVIEKAILS